MIPLILTKTGGILGPFANILGFIMDVIFRVFAAMGIYNIGLCIIVFTIVTRIIMLPLSYKQAQSSKLMGVIQPEIKLIQEKYKGKSDQQSMMMMNAEMKATYDKYGTSMTGSMVQLLIQMPILFALYRVIMNIPAYVPSVKQYFVNITDAIGGESAIAAVNQFILTNDLTNVVKTGARISSGELSTVNHIIDFLYSMSASQWELFKNAFSSAADVISANYATIEQMNTFLGINLANSPSSYGLLSPKCWIIPVLAGLSQYLSAQLMTKANPQMNSDEAAAGMMNSMNIMMPLISVFFCFKFAAGIGIYWVASSVIMGVQQYFLNRHMAKIDVNELVKKNIEKANAKRAKQGLSPINEKATEDNLKRMQQKAELSESRRQSRIEESRNSMQKADSYYGASSISERAKMVQRFNEKEAGKKK